MAEKFFVECHCKTKIQVELYEAGSQKTCPTCKSIVAIPNTNVLKEMTGDKYPLLRPIEKILRTLSEHEDPFSGQCHGCQAVKASYQIPITLNSLVERRVDDDSPIRLTMLGEIKLVAGKTEEIWQTTTFPLLLCEQCHEEFKSPKRRAKVFKIGKTLALVLLLVLFLYFAYFNMEVVAALSGLFWVVGLAAWIAGLRDTQKVDSYALKWIDKIRWATEAISAEEEYTLTVGQTQSFNAAVSEAS